MLISILKFLIFLLNILKQRVPFENDYFPMIIVCLNFHIDFLIQIERVSRFQLLVEQLRAPNPVIVFETLSLLLFHLICVVLQQLLFESKKFFVVIHFRISLNFPIFN